jgi:hypothetical protein
MPLYYFNLKTGGDTIRDPDGTDLPDEPAAKEHARHIACELMRQRQQRTRSWRIEVCDGEGRRCLNLLFASVDDSIGHLSPEARGSIENVAAKAASLHDEIRAIELTIARVKGTMARAEGRPYVAAIDGEAVIPKSADTGPAA